MSVVVADTSPLNYLVQCEVAAVLGELYGEVVIPQAVLEELTHRGAPDEVRRWMEARPSWTSVRSPAVIDDRLNLGRGEVEAICLAKEIHADEILLDDSRARRAALERGLTVTGTLGVLEATSSKSQRRCPSPGAHQLSN